MPSRDRPALSPLENRVMRVVWRDGAVTADQVRSALTVAPPLKDSTVRTILRRLESKGYVAHRRQGRTFVYSPTVAPRNAAADAVRSIIQRFCNGSVEDLLIGMVDGRLLSEETLRELAQRVARERTAGRARKSDRRKPRN